MPADAAAPEVLVTVREAPQSSLLADLRNQVRITGALILREIYTRFGRENLGFAWIIIEPALFCLSVILLWSVIQHSGHSETPIVPFLMTGYMPLLMYRHMVMRTMRCMQANSALLYHRHITILSLYAARIVVEILGTSAAFGFCLIVFYFAGYVEIPDSPGLMLGGWLLYAWYSAATALLVGALSERSELVEKIWSPISYIMIPLSGTFYMVYWIPDQFREIILWMPPVNGVEMIRGGYFGPGVPTFYSASYFAYVSAVLTAMALFLTKDARKFVEVE
ncbi:ABC transporter permease [uncultured Enterovirga sp.]|uniref:ABC transporter permease n=1 Tax=uncultured Enterovirga sp. TaxID=2026352 RepID=UPI0035C9EDAB